MAIAAAGDGRIWVLWTKGFGDPDVLARRSNKGATRFGATVNAGHPKDAAQAYKLDANAAGNALDVLANFNIGTTTDAVTSYRRLLPGLTLQAQPGQAARGRADRGALHGARRGRRRERRAVKVAGRSGTTDDPETFQNLGYALQWPLFSGFVVYAYYKFVRYEDAPPEPRRPAA